MPNHAAAPSRRVTRGHVVTGLAILVATAAALGTAMSSPHSVAVAGPQVPAAITGSSTSTSAQVSTTAEAAIALMETTTSTTVSPAADVPAAPAAAPAPAPVEQPALAADPTQAPAPAAQATPAADPTPVPAELETTTADPAPAEEPHAAEDSSAANWMEALIPEVDPNGEANWVFERKGGWGASDGHTNFIDPNVPSDKRFSVMVHELSHVKQVEVYGSLTKSVAAMSAITGAGASNVAANEKTADCMALMLGATWINYGCPDSLSGAAAAILAGHRP
jgi:hypothetical protein